MSYHGRLLHRSNSYPLLRRTQTTESANMCLFGCFKQKISSHRSTVVAHKEAKREENDYQRLNENLLRIALKRRTSVNSLTDRDPTRIAIEKKRAGIEEAEKRIQDAAQTQEGKQ